MKYIHPFILSKYKSDYVLNEHMEKLNSFFYNRPIYRVKFSLNLATKNNRFYTKKFLAALTLLESLTGQKPVLFYVRFYSRLKKMSGFICLLVNFTIRTPRTYSFFFFFRRYLLLYYFAYSGYSFDIRTKSLNTFGFSLFRLGKLFSFTRNLFGRHDRLSIIFYNHKPLYPQTRKSVLVYFNLFGLNFSSYFKEFMYATSLK